VPLDFAFCFADKFSQNVNGIYYLDILGFGSWSQSTSLEIFQVWMGHSVTQKENNVTTSNRYESKRSLDQQTLYFLEISHMSFQRPVLCSSYPLSAFLMGHSRYPYLVIANSRCLDYEKRTRDGQSCKGSPSVVGLKTGASEMLFIIQQVVRKDDNKTKIYQNNLALLFTPIHNYTWFTKCFPFWTTNQLGSHYIISHRWSVIITKITCLYFCKVKKLKKICKNQ
jgi:hypothetical protein